MRRFALLVAATMLAFAVPALADTGEFPIKADDGTVIANHRLPAGLEAQIEKAPGAMVAGNPKGKVTLIEFYDLNCPYCRRASTDIDALMKKTPELRLVLVPFPVLGIPSIQGARVELAVAQLAPEKFYAFHRAVYAGRGIIDGQRAFAAAQSLGIDMAKVEQIANSDALVDVMKAHLRLGDAAGIQATPGLIVKGVAIVGYPGANSLAQLVANAQRCGAVVCGKK
ncbi:MAG: DsbA family protein [Pseudolabrys sp.]